MTCPESRVARPASIDVDMGDRNMSLGSIHYYYNILIETDNAIDNNIFYHVYNSVVQRHQMIPDPVYESIM